MSEEWEYEYQVLGNYGQGWEVLTTESTREEARARVREYDYNEPMCPHSVRKVRV